MWSVADIGKNAIGSVLNDPTGPNSSSSAAGSSRGGGAAGLFKQLSASVIQSTPSSLNLMSTFSSSSRPSGGSVRLKDYAKHMTQFDEVAAIVGTFDSAASDGGKRRISLSFKSSLANSAAVSPTTVSGPGSPLVGSGDSTSEIPEIFFESSFNLENPKTFSQLISLDSSKNVLLQEKLSHYIDIAEIRLISEIALRSSQFFTALSNITTLHARTLDCVANLKSIRSALAALDRMQVGRSLSILRLKQRLNRLSFLHEQIRVVQQCKSSQSLIQILLNQADYVGALDLMSEAMKNPGLDGVRVLMNVKGQLQEVSKLICSLASNDFKSICSEWCSANRSRTGVEPDIQTFQLQMAPISSALIRLNGFVSAAQTLRNTLTEKFKDDLFQIIASTVEADPEFTCFDDLEKDTEKAFRSLEFSSSLVLMKALFLYSTLRFSRLVSMKQALSEVVTNMASNLTAQDMKLLLDSAQETLTSITAYLVEFLHTACGKILNARSEQISQMRSKEFNELFIVCTDFLNSSEEHERKAAIAGVFSFRGILISLCKLWLSTFHSERTKELLMIVDSETWEGTQIAPDFQEIVANLSGKPAEVPNEQDNSQFFVLHGKSYRVITSCIVMIKILQEYVYSYRISMIQPDITNRLLEFLKAYNSRVCGLIVGGAAIQGNLKSITAKHLTITSQSMLFMVEILHVLKARVSDVIDKKYQGLLGDFDKVAGDYMINRDQILSRIVGIMTERVYIHSESISKIDWDKEGDDENAQYLKNLVSETSKLHRIMKRTVFADTLKQVFKDIFAAYNDVLGKKWSSVAIFSVAGKTKILADARQYVSELAQLEGVDGPSPEVEVLVNNVRIRDKSEIHQSQNSLPQIPKTQPTASAAVPSPVSKNMEPPKLANTSTTAIPVVESAFSAKKFASAMSFSGFGMFKGSATPQTPVARQPSLPTVISTTQPSVVDLQKQSTSQPKTPTSPQKLMPPIPDDDRDT